MGQTGLIGEIRMFAGNFAPRTWAFCEGQLLSIASNTALFSIIGTIYGGDGRTTFALPDLRGRLPVSPGTGPGLSPYREGQRGGVEHITLNVLELPNHHHTATVDVTIGANTEPATSGEAANSVLGEASANLYNSNAADEKLGSVAAMANIVNTGGNQSHENRQPYLAVNYIIALQGVFPSRG